MYILQVPSKISTLGESFLTEGALERPEACVLSKVVPQVAGLLKDTSTLRVLAFKIELDPLCVRILNSDGLVPLFWDALESFMLLS